jgi:hypothetical protein
MKMYKWIPSITCAPEEINMMIQFVLTELNNDPETENTAAIAGDTIIVGTVGEDGKAIVFECTIRRSNLTTEQAEPFMMPHTVNEGDPQ